MENVCLQQELVPRVHISMDSLVSLILHAQMVGHGTALQCNVHALKIHFGMVKLASHVDSDRFISTI
jgi:hypothetical protein